MAKTFSRFEEIEEELKALAPPVVYKYRNWKDDKPKRLLTAQQVWFPHPFDLNDPLDVRPETLFNTDEFNDIRYFQKLLASVSQMRPNLQTDFDRRIEAEQQWKETKANPEIVIKNHKEWTETRDNYNRYGVFSTSKYELNNEIWEKYGDQHSGYCLGFKTVDLCRQMKSGYGFVNYSDKPYLYSFLDKKDDELDTLYLKKLSWEYEKEFRFITVGIGVYAKRLQIFSIDTVSEVVLGYNISDNDEKEILVIIDKEYPKGLHIYKTKRNDKEILCKIRIQ